MRRGRRRVLAVGVCLLVVLGGIAPPAAAASGLPDESGAAETTRGTANQPPLAEAGLDREVPANGTVFLDATGSTDPDGSVAEYDWRIERPDGSSIRPVCRSCARTRFVARQPGRYNVTVTVTDDDGAQRSDTARVVAAESNGPTVTVTGPDSVFTNATHNYSASATAGDVALTRVLWFLDGQRVAMTDIGGDSATPGLSRVFESNGTQEVRVEVVDRLGRRDAATQNVTVYDASVNHAPVVSGLDDHTVQAGESVTLTVEASDVDGDSLDFSWWVADSGDAEFSDETGPEARVTMPTVGSETTFEVVLSVGDGNGGRVNTTAEVTVEPARPGAAPTGRAGTGTGTGTGDGCIGGPGSNCGDGPPRYKDPSAYDAGWCTMGEQAPRGTCSDGQYAHPGNQYMLVDNGNDREIRLPASAGNFDLLVGVIPESSDIAAIFVSKATLERVKTRAWKAYWNENISEREAAIRQGESTNRNYD